MNKYTPSFTFLLASLALITDNCSTSLDEVENIKNIFH